MALSRSWSVVNFLLAAGVASAQGTLWSFPADSTGDMQSPGDLDADGVSDFVVGDPLGGPGGSGLPGKVRAYSGKEGTLLYEILGTDIDDRFGYEIEPLSDLDGDGASEIAIGTAGLAVNYVRVVSGRTGATRYTVTEHSPGDLYTAALCATDDVDGDGANDFAIGAVLAWGFGRVAVVSGSTGSILRVLSPPTWGDGFGADVAAYPDLDGDGVDELLVGHLESCTAHILSPSTGNLLHTLTGPLFSEYGYSLSAAGDVDADGLLDVVVGAPSNWHDATTWGSVFVYSGANWSLIHQIDAQQNQMYFGIQVAAYGDLDQDGRDDFVTMYAYQVLPGGLSESGATSIRSGQDAGVLYKDPTVGSFRAIDDFDHDGRRDYIQGGIPALFGSTNRVALLGKRSPEAACPGAAGSPEGCEPYLAVQGAPSLSTGDELVFRVSSTPPNRRCLLFWGFTPQATPFASGLLCVGPPIVHMPVGKTSTGSGICGGTLTQSFTKAYMSQMGLQAGTPVIVQFLGYGPPGAGAGIALSDSIQMTIWP